ncbi:PREDICTED: F-box/kelch-repeat protein At5g26960 [Tarenaya hassleriana]|uniref:F-box/kelch-repeat protein At5g26960 n=1 Tax=Tarenaya hassleriana TaxID=28532 RepID=UPI00053C2FB8|nr:PREDICTED: F-box/kelch-repeat protein At5g26960 [Tarenaya hassleriana]
MSESCNSRHFSWLMKSCRPNPSDAKSLAPIHQPSPVASSASTETEISSLPDDLLLECLSRIPSSYIPSLAAVCRRWSRLLLSPYFLHLRRRLGLLRHSLLAISAVESGLFAAILQFQCETGGWRVSFAASSSSSTCFDGGQVGLAHARAVAIGSRVYVVSRNSVLRYNSWMGTVTVRSPMLFPRKKFAMAVVSGKIYVAGGGGGGSGVAAAVEEYDPQKNRWRVVAQAPRRRYGCIGTALDGVFYVIGGLKIVNDLSRAAAAGAAAAEAPVYASSMDLFDVGASQWPFWRFHALRHRTGGGGGALGEWRRLRSPPLPPQVRLDGTVRFSCVGVEDKVAVVQVVGCIDDLLRRSGRSERGLRESLVLVYDTAEGEWKRGADLPEVISRAACACVEW